MKRSALHRWFWIHKWTSLVCTAFLLLICVTGLPLVLREEIAGLLDDALPYASVPADAPQANIDHLVEVSRKMFPGEEILSVYVDDDEPQILVFMVSSWDAFKANRKALHSIKFDAHTGAVLKTTKPYNEDGIGFLQLMLNLHTDLFAGLPGELFMALMAVLFVLAIVSGVVVYAPFMRRLEFGTVRANRSTRLKWLDLHNLIGVTTLAWTLVVGVTGVINELSTPLFQLWQQTELATTMTPFKGKPAPQGSALSSQQAAFDAVKKALPEMVPTSIVFPGSPVSTPYHYLIWTKGKDPLTSRLFSPVLVNATDGKIAGIVAMPWYLRALEVSRPLHFGDYGGMPLKIIWILLDLVTIAVLGSGLYLWLSRRSSPAARTFDTELVASDAVAEPAVRREAAE
jgi:uncharacterized iron-regulated membrane protein